MQAYPLKWPEGWPRTRRRESSRFRTTFAVARDNLLRELNRMGGRYPLISTNVALRQDGLPYAKQRNPDDPGAAIYFEYKGKQQCIACDRWDSVTDNIHALGLTIKAIRGMARWGATNILDKSLEAFRALPSNKSDWREILGCHDCTDLEVAKTNYRKLRSIHHPDNGGNENNFIRIKEAYRQAVEELA